MGRERVSIFDSPKKIKKSNWPRTISIALVLGWQLGLTLQVYLHTSALYYRVEKLGQIVLKLDNLYQPKTILHVRPGPWHPPPPPEEKEIIL